MSQFEQLKLYYNRLQNINKEIKNLLEKSNFDEAITKTQLKDKVFSELKLITRYIQLTDEQKAEILEYKEAIMALEKENLDFLEKNMSVVSKELKLLNQKGKLTSKYEKAEIQQGHLVDVVDE